MTDPINRTEQVNATLDAATLSDVVNGAASPGTVISRLGRTLKTLAYLSTTSLYNWVLNVTSQVAAGPIITSDPTATSGTGGFKYCWAYQPFAFTQGPIGHRNYIDDVWTAGINYDGASRIDPTKPALWVQSESMFAQGNDDSPFGMECHLNYITLDGTQKRAGGFFLPHNGDAGQAGLELQLDYVNIADVTDAAFFSFDTVTKTIEVLGGGVVKFAVNDTPLIQCKNADGSAFVELIRMNASNTWKFNLVAGVNFTGTAGASTLGGTSFLTEQCVAGLPAGGIYHQRNIGNVAGAASREFSTGAYAGLMTTQWVNSSNNAAAGQVHRVTTAGGADAWFIAENATRSYAWGVDTSDGNRLKFSVGAALGTTDIFSVDPSSRQMTFLAPIASSPAAGITASATQTRAGATQLTKRINAVATSASSGNAVGLPPSTDGLECAIINDGANPITVFPTSGSSGATETIDGGSAGAGVMLTNGKRCWFFFIASTGNWVSAQMGAPSA